MEQINMYQVLTVIGLIGSLIGLVWGTAITINHSTVYPKGIDQKLRHFYIALIVMLTGSVVSLGSILLSR